MEFNNNSSHANGVIPFGVYRQSDDFKTFDGNLSEVEMLIKRKSRKLTISSVVNVKAVAATIKERARKPAKSGYVILHPALNFQLQYAKKSRKSNA